MLDLPTEYKIAYKHIKFISHDMWQNMEPEVTWEQWLFNNSVIAIESTLEVPFYAEAAFLAGALGYEIDVANKLVAIFYATENKIKENKTLYGRKNAFITRVLGV